MFFGFWIQALRRALSNILDQRLIHFISTGTITISFLFFGAFILVWVNINAWLLEMGQSLSMSVYLEDGIGEEERLRVEEALEGLSGAEVTDYISKDKAMEELREAFGPQAALLDGLERNPLPASFELVFKEVDVKDTDPEMIKARLESLPDVEEVQYSEQWIDRFEGILNFLRTAGVVVGGLLCLAVLFIITNTIKLTIYARRDEMEIFKLVGATDWFVKAPFLIEGALQGLMGGALALGFLFGLTTMFSLQPLVTYAIPFIDIVFLPVWAVLGLGALSVFLGLVGGLIAVGRFFNPVVG